MNAEKPGTKPGPDSLASDSTRVAAEAPATTVLHAVGRTRDTRRVVTHNVVVCTCACGERFRTTATAVVHVRTQRHVVYVSTSSSFTIVPDELLDRVWPR